MSQSSLPPLPAVGVTPNAWNAWGGICRLTARRFVTLQYWLLTLGLLSVLALLGFAAMGRSADLVRFTHWVASFYLRFLVPIMAFISMAGAVRDDLKPGVADYLFTRPVRRPVYIAFRYLAQMAALQLDFLLAFAVVGLLGIALQGSGVIARLPVLLFSQALLIVVFGAFGLLCGVLTSRYVLAGLAYGVVVEIGLGAIPTPLNQLAMTRQVLQLWQPALHGSAPGIWQTTALPAMVAAGLLVLAALIFSRQERAGSPA